MPNRILRDGILTSPSMAKLGWAEECFYRRLFSVADDFGRYFADPGLLRAACYPRQLTKVSDSDIVKWLGACSDAGLVRVYPAQDGERYLEIAKFGQQVRAKKSKYPDPPSACNHLLADAQQPPADAHLDVSVFVSEDVSDKAPPAPVDKFEIPAWIPADTWAAYLKTRTGKKAKNEPHALGLIVKDLAGFRAKGHDPVAVLNASIKSGWAGVFEPKAAPQDVARQTVPSTDAPDPALQKLKEDDARAAKPSDEVRRRMAEITRKVTV